MLYAPAFCAIKTLFGKRLRLSRSNGEMETTLFLFCFSVLFVDGFDFGTL